jgi:hypothetical protein
MASEFAISNPLKAATQLDGRLTLPHTTQWSSHGCGFGPPELANAKEAEDTYSDDSPVL